MLVALAMILRLQVATVGLRAPEQALAALRGVGRRRSWVLGLSEPWLLVLVSVPLGLVAGYAAAAGLARAWLRPGLVLEVPTASVVGAALVTLAMAAVSAVAVAQGMRETIAGRLAGVHRPGASSRAVVAAELVVVLLALVLPLTRVGADPTAWRLVDLLLPVAIAVAAGLVTTRVVAAVASRWTAAAPSARCRCSSPPGPWRAGRRGRWSSSRSRRPSPSPCSPSGSTASPPAGGPASPRPWRRPTTSTTRR